ncbi:BatA domain-containing protein [soil metagenome]
MLFGIAAVSVPIVIHLLNNRRVQHIRWAAMRFLRASVERNQRRMRIEDLLLLIIRCAVVALLAVALARPVLRAAGASILGRSAVSAVILIDNSYSMSATDGVSSRFDIAKKSAGQVIDSLPGGSSVAVWLSSDIARPIIPEPAIDLNLARSGIRDAILSDRRSDVLPALKQAVELLRRRAGTAKELYVITDGQLGGFNRLEEVRRLLDDAKQDLRCRFILVGGDEDRNLCVSDLQQASGLAPVDRPLRFEVTVTNSGQHIENDVRITLFVDAAKTEAPIADGPIANASIARRPVADAPVADAMIDSIEAGKSKTISLYARFSTPGWHTVTARIAADRVPADDMRTIAVRAVNKVNVLMVDGDPGREARDGETFFLAHALVPVPPAEAENYFVRTMTISPSDLPGQNFDEFDAVVLANGAEITPQTADALASRIQRGGGLIVFPGDRTDIASYNRELVDRLHVLPARFGATIGDAKSEKTIARLQEKNFEHPIARLWNDPASGSPASASFYKMISPDSLGEVAAATVSVVLRFNDGSPAVIEGASGDGCVILFASTCDTAWNDLAVKPGIFVPLMYRCLGSIVQHQDEQLTLRAGAKLMIRPPAELIGRDAVITTPIVSSHARARQTRRVELVDRDPMLLFDDTDVAGAYEIVLPDQPMMKFAVQGDPAESDLRSIDADQRQVLASAADVIDQNNSADLVASIEHHRVGKELWIPLAIAVLALAVSETVLAFWFSRPKQ